MSGIGHIMLPRKSLALILLLTLHNPVSTTPFKSQRSSPPTAHPTANMQIKTLLLSLLAVSLCAGAALPQLDSL